MLPPVEDQSKLPPSKANSKTSSEYSYCVEVNSDKSVVDNDDDDKDEQENDNDDDDEQSEVSIEFDLDTDIMSTITSTLYPVENSAY